MEVQGIEEALNVAGMEEADKVEGHMISAAAFVEGGIQDACDDACSICLEEFCESEPFTLTSCKHEFHLQCILEWCQRSSQCPMCWQPISLKDPTSQELLEAVEQERSFRLTPSRNATIFHHPTLGDFELQHVPMNTNDPQLEARIIQHLTAAASMGRARHFARREGQRSRPSAHGRPQYLVFSSHHNTPTSGPASASMAQIVGETEPAPISLASPSIPPTNIGDEESHHIPRPIFASGSAAFPTNHQGSPLRVSSSISSSPSRDRAGPSDFQSFSESLKSRFSSMSVRYKESISKGTKGWKERFFSRGSSGTDHGSENRRDSNAEFATAPRIVECSETKDDSTTNHASISGLLDDNSDTEQSSQDGRNHGENPLRDREMPSSCLDGSAST